MHLADVKLRGEGTKVGKVVTGRNQVVRVYIRGINFMKIIIRIKGNARERVAVVNLGKNKSVMNKKKFLHIHFNQR
jgi:hypothetical protein